MWEKEREKGESQVRAEVQEGENLTWSWAVIGGKGRNVHRNFRSPTNLGRELGGVIESRRWGRTVNFRRIRRFAYGAKLVPKARSSVSCDLMSGCLGSPCLHLQASRGRYCWRGWCDRAPSRPGFFLATLKEGNSVNRAPVDCSAVRFAQYNPPDLKDLCVGQKSHPVFRENIRLPAETVRP